MRTLVVGAGAVGGYFGGRLAAAGRDITFLVRPRRAAELTASGLRIRSRYGDVTIPAPRTVLAADPGADYDLVLLSCKAYDLDGAIADLAPAVGPKTAILPLLNGMRHLETLRSRFGSERVLGGECFIAATLGADREIVHMGEPHGLTWGELDGVLSSRARSIEALMRGALFNARASAEILLDMWEKWVFLATLAGSTCLMRAPVGDIVASPGGGDFVLRLLDECRSVAEAEGYAPREASLARARSTLTAPGSPLTASMLRDVENGAPVEADHIVGDLMRRARSRGVEVELLPLVWMHLKAYEARRLAGR